MASSGAAAELRDADAEALAAIEDVRFAVERISLEARSGEAAASPGTAIIHVMTKEGEPYVVELTSAGYRVVGRFGDAPAEIDPRLQGAHFETLHSLLDTLSTEVGFAWLGVSAVRNFPRTSHPSPTPLVPSVVCRGPGRAPAGTGARAGQVTAHFEDYEGSVHYQIPGEFKSGRHGCRGLRPGLVANFQILGLFFVDNRRAEQVAAALALEPEHRRGRAVAVDVLAGALLALLV